MRIGFFDIEASNLSANYGILLTACIKPYGENNITKIVKKSTNKVDTLAVKETIKALNQYDLIVTWYGVRYDVPFIKTRALLKNIPFGIDPRIRHLDLWDACRKYMKFTSNRLDTVSTDLGFAEKTRISGEIWNKAVQGDSKAVAYVLHHNVKDVQVLEKVYNSFAKQNLLREIKSIPRV